MVKLQVSGGGVGMTTAIYNQLPCLGRLESLQFDDPLWVIAHKIDDDEFMCVCPYEWMTWAQRKALDASSNWSVIRFTITPSRLFPKYGDSWEYYPDKPIEYEILARTNASITGNNTDPVFFSWNFKTNWLPITGGV